MIITKSKKTAKSRTYF